MVILNGADGVDKSVFVSLSDRLALVPQPEVYATLALSPVAAAALDEYFILTTCEVSSPESITALVPNEPTNDHCQPLAVPVKAGAV